MGKMNKYIYTCVYACVCVCVCVCRGVWVQYIVIYIYAHIDTVKVTLKMDVKVRFDMDFVTCVISMNAHVDQCIKARCGCINTTQLAEWWQCAHTRYIYTVRTDAHFYVRTEGEEKKNAYT